MLRFHSGWAPRFGTNGLLACFAIALSCSNDLPIDNALG